MTTLIVLACCFTPAVAHNEQDPDEKTLAFLKKFRTEYTQALINKNADAVADYFAADIRLMPEYQKTVLSKANALAYHKAFLSRFDFTAYDRQEVEVLDLGTRVIEFGLFTQKLLLKGTKENHELKGKYANIWQRTADGKLSLITEAWNYNHQVNIARLLVFEEVPAVTIAFQPHMPVNNSISFELAAYNHLQEIVITEHNPKLWSMFYTDDYMLLYSGHTIYKGRKEMDAYIEEHVKHLPVFEKLDIRNDRIDDLGTYVIEYASHTAIVRDGDWSGVATGKDIRIWRREKNGALRIYRGVAMYD